MGGSVGPRMISMVLAVLFVSAAAGVARAEDISIKIKYGKPRVGRSIGQQIGVAFEDQRPSRGGGGTPDVIGVLADDGVDLILEEETIDELLSRVAGDGLRGAGFAVTMGFDDGLPLLLVVLEELTVEGFTDYIVTMKLRLELYGVGADLPDWETAVIAQGSVTLQWGASELWKGYRAMLEDGLQTMTETFSASAFVDAAVVRAEPEEPDMPDVLVEPEVSEIPDVVVEPEESDMPDVLEAPPEEPVERVERVERHDPPPDPDPDPDPNPDPRPVVRGVSSERSLKQRKTALGLVGLGLMLGGMGGGAGLAVADGGQAGRYPGYTVALGLIPVSGPIVVHASFLAWAEDRDEYQRVQRNDALVIGMTALQVTGLVFLVISATSQPQSSVADGGWVVLPTPLPGGGALGFARRF